MNICEVIKLAEKVGCAFRRRHWTNDSNWFAYHGMDNILTVVRKSDAGFGQPVTPCISTFFDNDWELCEDQPYNGRLINHYEPEIGDLRST